MASIPGSIVPALSYLSQAVGLTGKEDRHASMPHSYSHLSGGNPFESSAATEAAVVEGERSALNGGRRGRNGKCHLLIGILTRSL